MQPALELVDLEIADGVALVAMNRPDKRNAMSSQLLDELVSALRLAQDDPAVAAMVLTGRGSAFSAGADRSAVTGLQGEELARVFGPLAVQFARQVAQLLLQLVGMPKPVVAAVNGHAAGGAMVVALGCDFRVVSQDALFWMPEMGMGRAVGQPSMETLVACVGPLAAKDIVLTARKVGAPEMARLNLVQRVVPPADVLPNALEWARSLAQLDREAVATVKARANQQLVAIWRRAVEAEG